MLYLAIGIGAALLFWISTLAIRHLDTEDNQSWTALQKKRVKVEDELRAFLEGRSGEAAEAAEPSNPHAEASVVYGHLHAGKLDDAINAAELAMAKDGQDADARLLLAAALLASGEHLEAAGAQLSAAEKLGASGALVDFLSCHIEIEQYLAASGAGSNNAVLMPVELLALELHLRLGDSGDASALWLPGEGGEVSKEEARDFVIVHFNGYYRLLQTMIKSMREREYSDGLYLVARLALKCGFSEEGGRLMLSLEDEMKKSAAHKSFRRDLALIRGEKPVVKEETVSSGKKLIKLKVLN